jgi:hypothetical protein
MDLESAWLAASLLGSLWLLALRLRWEQQSPSFATLARIDVDAYAAKAARTTFAARLGAIANHAGA